MELPRPDLATSASALRESGLFDPDWYRDTYPDVVQLAMDPAEHYLKYGALMLRDPRPDFSTRFYMGTHPHVLSGGGNPILEILRTRQTGKTDEPDMRLVLLSAADVVRATGDYQRGIALAERYLPPELQHTVRALRANQSLRDGLEEGWLENLNAYLAHYGLSGVLLQGDGSLLSRLRARDASPKTGGPLVSVIMAAWNAGDSLEAAARSILNQTWQNLELLIVDDASNDDTWKIMQGLAIQDERVRIARNSVNVGPYVSKNLALREAKGEYVTGHDADDWALPQRVENHLQAAHQSGARASVTYMLRMRPNGHFGHFTEIGPFSHDGFARLASISCLFKTDLLRETLGYWDSVRFGADSEMISRAMAVLGDEFRLFEQISMICLDHEASLTNDTETGIRTPVGLSAVRAEYKDTWSRWHQTMAATDARLDLIQLNRRYPTARTHAVPQEAVLAVTDTVWHQGEMARGEV